MTIEVQSPGMFTTVQDLGRPGFGPLGVPVSGAADPVALRLGNRLLGNPEGAAALELTLLGGVFRFPGGAAIAITGGDFDASVPQWETVEVVAGDAVRVGPARSGARAYLCVRGGIDVPLFLGSASTHVLSGLGGHAGRALRKGDTLRIGPPPPAPPRSSIRPEIRALLAPRKTIRVTMGPQADGFAPAAVERFYAAQWRVSEQSNRMGIRLSGPAIDAPHGGHMLTEGVSLGAVQVPADGQPIIVFVEMQTTGGYPKIANVISADLASLGQLRPRDTVGFALVEPAAALRLARDLESLLGSGEILA